MLPASTLNRRIKVLLRILQNGNRNIIHNYVRTYVAKESVSIGTTLKEVKPVQRPEYVPRSYCMFIYFIYTIYYTCSIFR